MNKKIISLCFLSLLVVGCNNSKGGKYDHVFDALTLKDNTSLTGYRVLLSLKDLTTNETLHDEQRYVYINRESQLYHFVRTGSTISNSFESPLTHTRIDEEYFFDDGSQYIKQADNTFKQIDGAIDQTTLNPTNNMHPSEKCFTEIDYVNNENTYSFKAQINASNANELFGVESGLETMTDTSFSMNVIDSNLQNVEYSYTINNIAISTRINIYYDVFTIVLPETR